MKSDPIKKNDLAFAAQLITCKTNLPAHAATLGLKPEQIAAQAADAVAYEYWVHCTNIMHQDGVQFTAWKNLMRFGGTPSMDHEPGVPVLPDAVPPVDPGIETRFRALVQLIKNHSNYNESIGAALGIEGADQPPLDPATFLPVLTLRINGNRVEVGWGWQGYQAYVDLLEIQVDRNDGKGYVVLTFDPTPGYTDLTPFPVVPAKWTYRAIYRVGEVQVGQWSSPVSITVAA